MSRHIQKSSLIGSNEDNPDGKICILAIIIELVDHTHD
jgi:hypothetical protein